MKKPTLRLNISAIKEQPAEHRPLSYCAPSFPLSRFPSIKVERCAPSVLHIFESAIEKINQTSTGKELIDVIGYISMNRKYNIRISLNSSEVGVFPNESGNASNGVGTGSFLHCNMEGLPGINNSGLSQENFNAIVVYHELVHVYHNIIGERIHVSGERYSPLSHEEAYTVGLGRFSNSYFTENKFRSQLGVANREQYSHGSALIGNDDTVMTGFEKQPLFPDF